MYDQKTIGLRQVSILIHLMSTQFNNWCIDSITAVGVEKLFAILVVLIVVLFLWWDMNSRSESVMSAIVLSLTPSNALILIYFELI